MPVFTPKLLLIISVLAIAYIITSFDVGWGYLEVYIASYLYSFSKGLTTSKVHMLYSIIAIGQIIGAQTSHLLISRLGFRETITLAVSLSAIAWLICSISTTIWGFIVPALLWGISSALRYLACCFF
jgi:MFS family permease